MAVVTKMKCRSEVSWMVQVLGSDLSYLESTWQLSWTKPSAHIYGHEVQKEILVNSWEFRTLVCGEIVHERVKFYSVSGVVYWVVCWRCVLWQQWKEIQQNNQKCKGSLIPVIPVLLHFEQERIKSFSVIQSILDFRFKNSGELNLWTAFSWIFISQIDKGEFLALEIFETMFSLFLQVKQHPWPLWEDSSTISAHLPTCGRLKVMLVPHIILSADGCHDTTNSLLVRTLRLDMWEQNPNFGAISKIVGLLISLSLRKTSASWQISYFGRCLKVKWFC